MTSPYPNPLTTVYCNDEDIANVCMGDYNQLCPMSNKLAYGVDGVILSADLWTLSSMSVDFEAASITTGNVIRLSQPKTVFKGNGETFGVVSSNGSSVTLRRLGLQASLGHPPSPAAGLTGIEFTCLTFAPQIEIASYNINQIFGVNQVFSAENLTTSGQIFHNPTQMYLLRDLNTLTVLYVAKGAYEIANRAANGEFNLKLKQMLAEYEDIKDRTLLKWGADGQAELPSSIFGARTTR